jgi:hypothetical protein
MLAESSQPGLTIMKGDVTMQVPISEVIARVSALEEYVDMPQEATGMTVTGRLKAQHSLFLAIRADVSELQVGQRETNRRLTQVEGRLTGVEGRLTRVEGRLTGVEGQLAQIESVLGEVRHGIVDIKKRLPRQDSS